MTRTKKIIYWFSAFTPVLALSQTNSNAVNDLLAFAKSVVQALTPIFFGLAIVYFFWGVAMYVRNAGDPKKAADGKTVIIHGVIAIAVMVSIFGIIVAIQDIFGIYSSATPIPVPNIY